MIFSCEGTGKTIEQAVENALFELKAPREDVDIKVLNEGGFLKKAKVLVTISEDAREKYEKKEPKEEKKEEKKVEVQKVQPKPQPQKKEEDFSANFMKKKIEKTEEDEDEEANEGYEKKRTPEGFLNDLIAAMKINATIEKTTNDHYATYNIVTEEKLSELIGHHGDCMLAIEHVMRLVCKDPENKKILLDVAGYRARRAESLTAAAKRAADRVARTGRYFKFEPMSACDRKTIHSALMDDDRVTTMSKGLDPNRFVIVFPTKYEE